MSQCLEVRNYKVRLLQGQVVCRTQLFPVNIHKIVITADSRDSLYHFFFYSQLVLGIRDMLLLHPMNLLVQTVTLHL